MATSRRNRYSKSLEGLNAIGIISPAVAYTNQTTFAAFVASAADSANNGKVAIIDASTNNVKTTALSAGDKFFIAQAVDGNIKKTPTMVFGTANNTNIKKTAYAAPTKQVVSVGYNGTAGTSGIAAPSAGSSKTYVLSVRDTSPSTQPFPVQEGRVKVTNSSASIYDIAAQLITDLQNLKDYYNSADINFVEAKLLLVGTDTQIATVTGTFTKGSVNVTYSGSHTLAVGEIVSIGNAGTSQVYKVVAVPSATTVVLDRPFVGDTVTTGAGGTYKVTVPTEVGIVISAIVEDTTFVVTLQENLSSATVTNTTAWRQGSGAPWQVALLEEQTAVMDGDTVQNAQWPKDYGQPTRFVVDPETSALQYTQYFISAYNKTASMAYPNEIASSRSYVIIACPNSGGPDTTISTVLGF
jgi:hypothetical protein